jgi:protein involved in polysaccharide export with SLBB domain
MSLGAQLPIRLEPDVQERLEDIAKQIGTSKSALLRLLARTFVEQTVDADGGVRLPPSWKDLLGRLPAADARSLPAARARAARTIARRALAANPASEASSKPAGAAARLLKRHVPSAPGRGVK